MNVRVALLFLLCTTTFLPTSYCQQKSTAVASMGKLKLAVLVSQNGIAEYAVSYDGKYVINWSRLGFVLNDTTALDSNFQLLQTDTSSADNTWKPVWGEVSQIRNHYQQLTVHLQQKTAPHLLLNVVFKVFEDGVGFRYEFPTQPNLKYFIITDEKTQFNLTGNHKVFWIPGEYDSNEYLYTTSKLSEVDAYKMPMMSAGKRKDKMPDQYGVQTPLMMKTDDGLYINIHEAALVNYPSMQLHVNTANYSLQSNLVPDAVGNKAYLRSPAHTPWRTIIVSDKATEILASKMILNLNEPTKIANTSWVKPTKFMGVWWEMIHNRTTWSYSANRDSLDAKGHMYPSGKHGATTQNVERYIDFASKHGIKALLVEGWNTGWEEWYGNWNGGNFDFVTPYPDFDLPGITAYAKKKGVNMIMHNETSGDAVAYEKQMDTAFNFMNHYGYKAVKTGYVGPIVPRGEHHDGQFMVNHYIYAAQMAAKHKIMIDMHEPVRPTGLHRTYPNWLACEASRGNEFNGFSEGSPPEHETILPFTRLMGGPMDYTPGIFKLRHYASDTVKIRMHTTLAKQLALYITMYSPLQMAADMPENYEAHLDAFKFIEDVALDWDDTKILEAEPGDYVTIARKEKGKNNWFIGGITDENSRTASIPLSFLDKGKKYQATIYRDADNANWEYNPEAYTIDKIVVTDASTLTIKLATGGGFAVSIMPLAIK